MRKRETREREIKKRARNPDKKENQNRKRNKAHLRTHRRACFWNAPFGEKFWKRKRKQNEQIAGMRIYSLKIISWYAPGRKPGKRARAKNHFYVNAHLHIEIKISKCDNRQAEKRERTHDLKYIYLWPSETSKWGKFFPFLCLDARHSETLKTKRTESEPREKMKSKHERSTRIL